MYESKQKKLKQAEEQAHLAHHNGNAEAARLAMGQVITLEQLLPQLAERVTQFVPIESRDQ